MKPRHRIGTVEPGVNNIIFDAPLNMSTSHIKCSVVTVSKAIRLQWKAFRGEKREHKK